MPDPVVPGPPASVLAQISNNPGAGLAPSSPALTGRATFTGASAGAFPFLPSLMTEIVPMPQSAFLDADVEIGGNLIVNGDLVAAVFPLLDPVAVQTANYNAAVGQFVPVSTASTAVTVTLPGAPLDGTLIGAQMVAQAASRNVTVAASASDVFNVAGGPTTLTLSSVDQGVLLQYSASLAIWYQIANSGPSGGVPSGAAGGVLSGTYPNPGFAEPGSFTVLTAGNFNVTGSVTAALSMGGSKITSLANGSGAQDAAAYGQILPISGGTMTGALVPAVVSLTDAGTISVNAAAGNDFRVTLGGNRVLGSPSSPADGQKVIFQVTQDATGGRSLTYASAYEFGSGLASPTLGTAASNTDLLGFIYNGTKAKWLFVAFASGFS